MRVVVVPLLLLVVGLTGCTTGTPEPVFECTNSTWIKAPGQSGASGVFFRNNTVPQGETGHGTKSFFENGHRSTIGQGDYHGGTLDVFMFRIEKYTSYDTVGRLKAYVLEEMTPRKGPDGKNTTGFDYTAGRQLMFHDLSPGGGYVREVVLPNGLINHTAVYRIELTDGTTFDPNELLITWDFAPNISGDSDVSVASWDTKVEYWYRTCTVTDDPVSES